METVGGHKGGVDGGLEGAVSGVGGCGEGGGEGGGSEGGGGDGGGGVDGAVPAASVSSGIAIVMDTSSPLLYVDVMTDIRCPYSWVAMQQMKVRRNYYYVSSYC